MDIDQKKIEGLKNGILPNYEPGLKDIVLRNFEKDRLHFTTDLSEAIVGSAAAFTAEGRPPRTDGSADLTNVLGVTQEISKTMQEYLVVITKSKVPLDTAEKVRSVVASTVETCGVVFDFDVASNPEFLKEGAAIDDFKKPDRIMVGVDCEAGPKNIRKTLPSFHFEWSPCDL